jgi:hypothetical protein
VLNQVPAGSLKRYYHHYYSYLRKDRK